MPELINSTPTHFDFAIGFPTRAIQLSTSLFNDSFPHPTFFLEAKTVQE